MRSQISSGIHFLPLLLLAILAGAQQDYIESDNFGYRCVTGVSTCQAFAAYRAAQGDTLVSVGGLFKLSAQQVSQASQISDTATLSPGQFLLIPLNCSCVSGRSQFNTSYIIQSGDTMFKVSQERFQGLTTYQAVERANPSVVPTQMEPGDNLIFPIRCACPSSRQNSTGVKTLVTYPIISGDSVDSIASSWNITTQAIQQQNLFFGAPVDSKNLQAITTLLLPETDETPDVPRQTGNSTPPPTVAPQPPPGPGSGSGSDSGSSSSSNTGAYVGIGVGSALAVVLLALAGFCFYTRRKRARKNEYLVSSKNQSLASVVTEGGPYGSISSSDTMQKTKQNELALLGMNDLMESERPAVFTYEELKEATNNFSESQRIQGSVYRGVLRNQLVAIKEMKGGASSQELKILCKVHHTNLIRLVGICSASEQLFLVYEYAENGSLSSYLHNNKLKQLEPSSSGASLSWNSRLQVALDVATGLEYIHDYTKPSFVHKDLKSSNILLDSSLRAKIANFGMARLAEDDSQVLTMHIAGTQGYMSPEYLNHGVVSTKLDVYSFGVVMLELFTGREAILSEGDGAARQFLAEAMIRVMDEVKNGEKEVKIEKLKRWLDPLLENVVPWDGVFTYLEIARACVDSDPDARPGMKNLTYKLSKLLESSLEWETAAVLNRRYMSAPLEGR